MLKFRSRISTGERAQQELGANFSTVRQDGICNRNHTLFRITENPGPASSATSKTHPESALTRHEATHLRRASTVGLRGTAGVRWASRVLRGKWDLRGKTHRLALPLRAACAMRALQA